jgi:hypothetical protein
MVTHDEVRGQLDVVRINRVFERKRFALGDLYGTSVCVTNGQSFYGQEILVKFDLKRKKEEDPRPLGSFISTDIPGNFDTLKPGEYVLLAHWQGYMHKMGRHPTLNEINRYFDPSDMPRALYLGNPNTTEEGRTVIFPSESESVKGDIDTLLKKYFSRPLEGSTVILTEVDEEVERIKKIASSKGLIAVVMEALR